MGAPGIYVGPGPVNPGAAVAGQPTANPNGSGNSHADPNTNGSQPQEVATLAPPAYPPGNLPDKAIEDSVFIGKRYYSPNLDLPNLASVTGNLVLRLTQPND